MENIENDVLYIDLDEFLTSNQSSDTKKITLIRRLLDDFRVNIDDNEHVVLSGSALGLANFIGFILRSE